MPLLIFLFVVYGIYRFTRIDETFIDHLALFLITATLVAGLTLWRVFKKTLSKRLLQKCPAGVEAEFRRGAVYRPDPGWMWTIRVVLCGMMAVILLGYLFRQTIQTSTIVALTLSLTPLVWLTVRSFWARAIIEPSGVTYVGLARTVKIPLHNIHSVRQADPQGANDTGWLMPQLDAAPEIMCVNGKSVLLVALGGAGRPAWEASVRMCDDLGLLGVGEHTCAGPLLGSDSSQRAKRVHGFIEEQKDSR